MVNNIVLNVDARRYLAKVFYHRNGEFKLSLPREELQNLCVNQSKTIIMYFYFNMKWSEMVLAHLVTELKAIGFSNIKLICPYLPDGKYIAKKYPCYGEPAEEVVGVYGKYLPSHYECVLRKA